MNRYLDLQDAYGTTLVSNDLGEFSLLPNSEAEHLRTGALGRGHPRYYDLVAKGLIDRPIRGGKGLEQTVLRTRKAHMLEGPSLHIFVVTLRCDHACAYCQVSRAAIGATGFDMSRVDADHAIDRVFESPAPSLTVEFQGGEPTLRFDLIRYIVSRVVERNVAERRHIHFSLVSTLHHLTDDDLTFCADHGIHISTSIDGPRDIHNRFRHNPGSDSWERTTSQLKRVRATLGHDGVVAMPTLTRAALASPEALIDTYVDLEFNSVFLRPISPYGFALKTRRAIGYPMSEFITFYAKALDYLLTLNRTGTQIGETYSAVLLRHILTPFGSNYVDLRSPAGAGLGVLVYNYDGQVYPADEARMAAESGDARFALGRVNQPLDELISSPAMQWLMTGAVADELPGCSACGFLPFCGADPVYHAVAHGDPVGDRQASEFCQKHTGLFKILFGHLRDADPENMRTLLSWALGRSRMDIVEPGYIET